MLASLAETLKTLMEMILQAVDMVQCASEFASDPLLVERCSHGARQPTCSRPQAKVIAVDKVRVVVKPADRTGCKSVFLDGVKQRQLQTASKQSAYQ